MGHLFILAALIVFSTSAPAAARPNVLLILADDLGWADLSPDPYDNPHVRTPHLEALARGGMAFTNYYSPGAVCSPARAGILTGHNPARYGIHTAIGGTVEINEKYDQPSWLDSATPTLAKMLQTAGYRTAVIGKWHLGSAKGAPRPDTYGFDLARTTTSRNRERGWDGIPRVLLADAQVDASLDFIDETPAGTPWLLYLSLLVPHATLDMLGETLLDPQYDRFRPKKTTTPYAGTMAIYYSTVTMMDTAIGRLLDELEERGLTDETIVVFTSDNGPAGVYNRASSHSAAGNPGPHRGRKGSLFDGGLATPLIVSWPGVVPDGAISETHTGGVDLLPTLVAMTGAPLPTGYVSDGEDMSDVWTGGGDRDRTTLLFWKSPRPMKALSEIDVSPGLAVRRGDWKLLMEPDRTRRHLYNTATDSLEVDDMQSEQPAIADQLEALLLRWVAKH